MTNLRRSYDEFTIINMLIFAISYDDFMILTYDHKFPVIKFTRSKERKQKIT